MDYTDENSVSEYSGILLDNNIIEYIDNETVEEYDIIDVDDETVEIYNIIDEDN